MHDSAISCRVFVGELVQRAAHRFTPIEALPAADTKTTGFWGLSLELTGEKTRRIASFEYPGWARVMHLSAVHMPHGFYRGGLGGRIRTERIRLHYHL